MYEADTDGGDKYFHCMANYQATERGWSGWAAAKIMSDTHETLQASKNIYNDGLESTLKDTSSDQKANKYG